MDLSLSKLLNMRMYFLMVSLFLMGGNYVTAQQTPPSASPVVQPDKSWVLKDYPQAKEIRWKEEKKMGGYEFEFINEGQEVEIYFDYSGRQIRKKEEKQDRIHRPEQPRGKKRGTEGDDSQEYQY